MIKSIKSILSTDKEKYKVPKKVQDVIPIKRIWPDGIFLVGSKFVKSWKFTDINYLVASREDKKTMFLAYSELLNSLDSGASTKITINNHRMKKEDFEQSVLMPMKEDGLDEYREEYNQMLLDKALDANGIIQEKYITVTIAKKNIEVARAYFARVGADLSAHFTALGSKCIEMTANDRLRALHDFYRSGEESAFDFNRLDCHEKLKRVFVHEIIGGLSAFGDLVHINRLLINQVNEVRRTGIKEGILDYFKYAISRHLSSNKGFKFSIVFTSYING